MISLVLIILNINIKQILNANVKTVKWWNNLKTCNASVHNFCCTQLIWKLHLGRCILEFLKSSLTLQAQFCIYELYVKKLFSLASSSKVWTQKVQVSKTEKML